MTAEQFLPDAWTAWRRWVDEGRVRSVRVSPSLLVEILKRHDGRRYYLNTTDALPDDAVVVNVDRLPLAEPGEIVWVVTVASASFEPMTTEEIPPLHPMTTVTYDFPTDVLETIAETAGAAFVAYGYTQEDPKRGDAWDVLHDAMGRLGYALYQRSHPNDGGAPAVVGAGAR